jgi:hypothetical protein
MIRLAIGCAVLESERRSSGETATLTRLSPFGKSAYASKGEENSRLFGLAGPEHASAWREMLDPLLPTDAWDWFCLDGVPYHDRILTIVWDRTGNRYNRGAGSAVWADGHEIARLAKLSPLSCKLPPVAVAH